MGVTVISLGTPRSTGENFSCTWDHLGLPATTLGSPMTSLGVPATCLGSPMTSLGALATSLGAPQITVEQSGKNDVFFGNAAGAPGNHRYYLSFNNFEYSCIQCVFSSIYRYSYPSTHGISGLAGGGA